MRTLKIGAAEVRVFPDDSALNLAIATAISTSADAKPGLTLALSGGSTPKAVYRLMADGGDIQPIEYFFGDERCVPSSDPESNYRMARESLFDRAAIPGDQVHRVPTELGHAEAAVAYEREIRELVPALDGVPVFDLVLLGMGPDGHTASLFPGTDALAEQTRVVTSVFVPRLDTHRVTFTYPLINRARAIWFLTAGEGKAEMLRNILNGDPQGTRYPAQDVNPIDGELVWWVDEAAARLLR